MIYLHRPRMRRNPFGGLDARQLPDIVQPRPFTDEVRQHIRAGGRRALQFIGRQGRGKTTHLRLLAGEFPEGSLHMLPRESSEEAMLADPSPLLFVDSIHHLSFAGRRALFRKDAFIVFTTHYTRWPACRSVGMPLTSYRFRGLTVPEMTAIIRARTQDAMEDPGERWAIDEDAVQSLVRKFGDDYRGILNYLYQHTDLPA